MGLQYFTFAHILISLVGITAGFGMLAGLLAGKLFTRWTAAYLIFTIATSVTGFFFPFNGFTPALGTGIISMVVLGIACYALYIANLAGKWRATFAITATLGLYFNTFVLVVQTFQKFPDIRAIAPTQASPLFGITQGIVLLIFIALIVAAVKRFRPSTTSPAREPELASSARA